MLSRRDIVASIASAADRSFSDHKIQSRGPERIVISAAGDTLWVEFFGGRSGTLFVNSFESFMTIRAPARERWGLVEMLRWVGNTPWNGFRPESFCVVEESRIPEPEATFAILNACAAARRAVDLIRVAEVAP